MVDWTWEWSECDIQQCWIELFDLWEAAGVKSCLRRGMKMDEEVLREDEGLEASFRDSN